MSTPADHLATARDRLTRGAFDNAAAEALTGILAALTVDRAPTGEKTRAEVIAAHTFTTYPEQIVCECGSWQYGAPHPLTRAEHDDHLIAQWSEHLDDALTKAGL